MLRFAVAIGAICSVRALPYDDLNEDDPLSPEQTALIEKSDAFSQSKIAEAIRQGDVDLIINDHGYRPLHATTVLGHTEIVRELLEQFADANARLTKGKDRATPLHLAAEWGRVDIVRQLVRDGGAQIDAGSGSSSNETALEIALIRGREHTAHALIDLGARVDIISGSGWTPLATAAAVGAVDLVKKLIKAGADPSQRLARGYTALHGLAIVAEWSAAGLVALYQGGADLNARDDNGRTLLFLAAEKGSFAIVELLIWLGADATIGNNDGVLPAEIAEQNGHAFTVGEIEFLRVYGKLLKEGQDHFTAMALTDPLLDRGADIDEPTSEDAMTFLAFACAQDERGLIGLFVSRGADPSRAPIDCEPYLDFIGRVALIALEGRFSRERLDAALSYANREFPLHMACLYGDDSEVIKPLMALGYKVNAFEDEAGEQPLHSAVIHGRPAIARALISAGADLAGRMAGGHTPLHCAAHRGSEEVTKLLLDAGADPTAHNDVDDTPYDSAIKHGHTEVADLIARHGGTMNSEDLVAWRRQRSPLDDPLSNSVDAYDRLASETISEAIKNGDPNHVPEDKDAWEGRYVEGMTVFHMAAQQGYVESVRELLRLGAETKALVRTPGQSWQGSLHVAALHGRARIVEILVQEGGVDVDTLSADNATALCMAVERGFVRTTQSLLRLGANPNVVCAGGTPLIYAKKAIIVDDLLRHGADVEARDTRRGYINYTALAHAAKDGKVDLVRSLLKAGADIEAKTYGTGDTALFSIHPRVVEVLLAHGAELSPVNKGGYTPLGAAAAYGNVKVVKALVRAGADPLQRLGCGHGNEGTSPKEIAAENGHHEVVAAMTRADKAANPRRYYLDEWGPVVAAVLAILGISWILPRMLQWRRSQQAVEATRDLLREKKARGPRRQNRNAQAARDREAARRREQERRDRESAAREACEREAAAREAQEARERQEAAARELEQRRLDREAAAEAADAARSREAAARAREDERREREAFAREREQERLEGEAEAETARAARDREAAAREREEREREAWEREKLDSLQAMAAWAAASEEKSEEPLGREESKEEPVPEGYEIVARILEHLGEPHLLPIFEAEDINDKTLPDLDPTDLIGLGVSQMTCLTILGAAHSAAKTKKLEAEEVLDNVAKHQSVLEETLREHREEIKRLRIRELPEDLMCPITCEIMKDPVLLMEDGHTYERVALEQWFATGARTSPSTSAQLDSLATAPNHTVRKLVAALLEEHRGRAAD